MARVYLDHAATTPLLPAVLDVYLDALRVVGNPSSIHADGQHARRMLEEARESIAEGLDCEPVELVFTSGGTESINLALKGMWWARQADGPRPRLLVPGGEHHATVDAVEWLAAAEGAVIDAVPLAADGTVTPGALAAALGTRLPGSLELSVPLRREPAPLVPFTGPGADAALATVIWANNEVGTVQPVAELAAVAAEAGVPLHVDAVAALGYVPVSFRASGAAALSVSAHKIGGPVGIGALVQGRATTVAGYPASLNESPTAPGLCLAVQGHDVCIDASSSDTGPYPDRSDELPIMVALAEALRFPEMIIDRSSWYQAQDVFG